MDTQAALQAIAQGPLAPVYLVSGTELYLQEQIKTAFFKRLNIESMSDLNFIQLDLDETSIDSVIAEAETVPFFEDFRLIFVENPIFLTAEKRQQAMEHNLDLLLDYLKEPLDTSIVVFFANYKKLDERKKVVKQLKKHSTLISVAPLSEEDARRYIQQTLANAEVKMDRQAFDLFLRLTDVDLSKMMQELDKILLYLGDEKVITRQIVADLIPKTLDHNIFDMTNYVLSGKADEAIRLYDDLHLQGEETIKINAILITQLRLLLQAKLLMELGYQQANIADSLNIHPYRVKLAMQQAKKFPTKLLMTMFDELVENDYLTKIGKLDKELFFQLFILKTAAIVKQT